MTNAPWLPGSTLNSKRIGTITLVYARAFYLRCLDCFVLFSPSNITSLKPNEESVTHLAPCRRRVVSFAGYNWSFYPGVDPYFYPHLAIFR